jgi:hypothetical protein
VAGWRSTSSSVDGGGRDARGPRWARWEWRLFALATIGGLAWMFWDSLSVGGVAGLVALLLYSQLSLLQHVGGPPDDLPPPRLRGNLTDGFPRVDQQPEDTRTPDDSRQG